VLSLSNLRQNTFILATYGTDNKDEFVNPFNPVNRTYTPWHDGAVVFEPIAIAQSLGHQIWQYAWDYGTGVQSNSGTETFGYHWMAHTLYTEHDVMSRFPTMVAPGDFAMKRFLRENRDSNAQSDLNWIFPSSYWYPPVFWQHHDRFKGSTRTTPNAANNYLIKRNRTGDVFLPSNKVILFENRDFNTKGQPTWNQPTARPQVALVDGSAKTVRMADIIRDTELPAGNGADASLLRYPSGEWNPGLGEMNYFFRGHLPNAAAWGFNWTFGNPAHFWATRNGVRGVDVR
jgi:hypothetical protein